MKQLTERQSTLIGWGLFTAATVLLVATMVTGHIDGLNTLAQLLGQVAQPICAAAIAVLLYLGVSAGQQESGV